MWPGPFLRRELTTSVRRSRAFTDRGYAIFLMGGLLLGCFLAWDWQGVERSSIVGNQRFSRAMFGLVVVGLAGLAIGFVASHAAVAIASERDHKTLDALLASRFSGAEIVLGAMASGLFRYANVAMAGLPLVVLVVFLGGIPPDWVILAALGLASTSILLAACGVAASVRARSSARALNLALSPFLIWSTVPTLFVILRPIFWPGAPPWLVSTVLNLVDGSPFGLVINLGGLIPRPGGPLWAILRMMAWELSMALLLVLWAIVRLRPASRGLYDVEGEATRVKRLRAAMRRPPRRPPCFSDPVLWYEMHSTLGQTAFRRLIGRITVLAMLVCLAWFLWWFARPALNELIERGYGPSPEAYHLPDLEPFARVLVARLFPKIAGLAADAAPGQARLEFNIILREFTALFCIGFLSMVFSYAHESVKGEQKRDTWLGLIATPLTAREILAGKALGSLWKARGAGYTLLVLWTLGLLTGAIHPAGYLAALVFLVVSSAFFAAGGLWMALRTSHPEKPPGDVGFSTFHLPLVLAASFILTAGPTILAFISLFTYEDIQAAIQARPFPEFRDSAIRNILGARSVLVLWLSGTTALALAAAWLTRANIKGFDGSIGRPVRPSDGLAEGTHT